MKKNQLEVTDNITDQHSQVRKWLKTELPKIPSEPYILVTATSSMSIGLEHLGPKLLNVHAFVTGVTIETLTGDVETKMVKLVLCTFLGEKSFKLDIYEPRCEKTVFLHMRKQRRRSASR